MEYTIQSNHGLCGKMVIAHPNANVTLNQADILELEQGEKETKVVCLDGMVWITQFDDPIDHFIRKGQSFNITQKGKAIIQGLPHGKVKVGIPG